MPLPHALLAQAADAPTPEARQAAGELSALLLAVALTILVTACALALLYLRRRTRLREELARSSGAQTPRLDAWEEASRRVPLEDDGSIPREPGTE